MSGKELGNCTHQWTTNDEKNKQALLTFSVFFRLKKKYRQQQKEERSREEDIPTQKRTDIFHVSKKNNKKYPMALIDIFKHDGHGLFNTVSNTL